jgi:hypothetical protein
VVLYAPLYNGLAAGLSLCKHPRFEQNSLHLTPVFLSIFAVFVGNGVSEYLVLSLP